MTRSVLFVCTGNTCRSPAAAALFASRLAEPQQWWVESAGIRAGRGAPATAEVVERLVRRGLDLARQRSKPLEDLPLEQFDLILVMEHEQRRAVQARFPALAERVFLLAAMYAGDEEVADPYGGGAMDYDKMLAALDSMLDRGMVGILERAEGGKKP